MLRPTTAVLCLALLVVTGCRGAYFSALEAFGVHKREVLVDRVEDARDAQSDAKESFATTLEAFRSVQDFDGGSLETLYDDLNARYSRCASRVRAVDARIDGVESVSEALFDEWADEIEQIGDPSLSAASEAQLAATQEQYEGLVTAMRRAEERMQPVLGAFKDRVLFLKHNLNAQAVASLEGTLGAIEIDVGELIGAMEAAIAEADAFIASMSTE